VPEGHVIHRLAGELNAHFGQQRVRVSSPQGRFAESAALLDRSHLVAAEAFGKHLFVEFSAAVPEPIVHIHLGLIGRLSHDELAPPQGQVRLRINNDEVAADLRGPQRCRALSPSEQERVVSALGPDPIRADQDPDLAWQRIHRSAKPIGALLMDQRITAGVGNIYRAEVLFRHRVKPSCPGNRLKQTSWHAVWADLVVLMRQGVLDGRIDTVLPEHSPEQTGRAPRVDRHGGEVYVYRRADQPCLVCGNPVRSATVEGRRLYWCGTCQRRH